MKMESESTVAVEELELLLYGPLRNFLRCCLFSHWNSEKSTKKSSLPPLSLKSSMVEKRVSDGSIHGENRSNWSHYGSVTTSGNNEEDKSPSGSDSASARGDRPRHRHSNSVDSSKGVFRDIIEAKKAMPLEKLAEQWTIDPKAPICL
ncbi:hypothetical protein AHAS_Ahas13G0366900 [Arachis hypogaea]